MSTVKTQISLEKNLQGFFFDQLTAMNLKTTPKLPQSMLYYSSKVLDNFAFSSNCFDQIEGRLQDKILGTKLLQSKHLAKTRQKKLLKEIGDTSLFLCGYFNESLEKRITGARYYQDLGRMAYGRLNHLVPSYFDHKSFYLNLASSFQPITLLISLMAKQFREISESGEGGALALLMINPYKSRAS